ncbi:MAG: transposase [Pseudomonadota bacterium]
MAKPQFTEDEIASILKEHVDGTSVRDLCRKYPMCDTTFYKWRKEAGLGKKNLEKQALESLKTENEQLKILVEAQAYQISQLEQLTRIGYR